MIKNCMESSYHVSVNKKGYLRMQKTGLKQASLTLGLVALSTLSCQLATANTFYSADRQWLLGDW